MQIKVTCACGDAAYEEGYMAAVHDRLQKVHGDEVTEKETDKRDKF
jgi:hypothetical protein